MPLEEGFSWLRSTGLIADPYVIWSRNESGKVKYHFLKVKEFFNQIRNVGLLSDGTERHE